MMFTLFETLKRVLFFSVVFLQQFLYPKLSFAQNQPGVAPVNGQLPPPTFAEVISRMSPMLLMVFFVFYFLVIKPQNKKQLDQINLLKNLKKGDNVLTNAGMIGRVAAIENDHLLIEIAKDIKVKFEKNSIQKLV